MPQTLTGDGTNYSNTAQAPTDGDLASVASVIVFFQRILDNAKHLYDKVFTSGVLAIRNVASVTAMKALTGMSNGQVCFVKGSGIYLYVDPDSTTEALPWIVQPTTGTGRWFHAMYALRDVANGFAPTDGSGKIALARVTNAIVATTWNPSAGSIFTTLTTSNTAFSGGPHVNLPSVKAGDIIEVDATVAIVVASGATSTGIVAELSLGTTPTTESTLTQNATSTDWKALVPFRMRHVCSAGDEAAGAFQGTFQGKVDSGTLTLTSFQIHALRVRQIRP